ncbi:hypothetical protein Taro_049093, partial [Colocasia esculenta]|nr:hypothetical protein [Colocasia esculenta]
GQTFLAKVVSTHLPMVSTQCFKAKAECCRNGEVVSTLDQVTSTLEAVPRKACQQTYTVDTTSSQVDTRDLSQGSFLPVWDSVSTLVQVRLTHSGKFLI